MWLLSRIHWHLLWSRYTYIYHQYFFHLSLSHDTQTHTHTFTHLLYSFIISLPCPSLPLSLSPPSSLSLPPPPSLSLSLSLSVAEVECDEDSMRTITFGNVNYDLRLCRESKWHSTVVYTNVHDCYVQQPTPIFSVSMGYQKVGVVLQWAGTKDHHRLPSVVVREWEPFTCLSLANPMPLGSCSILLSLPINWHELYLCSLRETQCKRR